ncbi:MAG: type I restriction enzyme HsdR N-terminal domain-containing protein [Bacteroidetes bacterium]|nr:type I restriction enzyme HsdR N-terminal domain-containing protein [Bacteroidota bacterium]
MQQLNLPSYQLKTREVDKKQEVFDIIRKKYIVLNPEEWVRQQFIQYLIHEKNYPPSLISIEKGVRVLGMYKRFDAVVAGKAGEPIALIEFKSPEVKISQKTFEQIARYNMQLKVRFLIVSNGMKHYCCVVNYLNRTYSFIEDIPNYADLTVDS